MFCNFVRSMPSATQFTYFAALMGSGIFFVFVAATIYLPFIIVSPAKFAAAFTLGSSLMMGEHQSRSFSHACF